MALEIALTNWITGAQSTYWRLLSLEINVERQQGLLVVGGYLSREWREAGGIGRYVDEERVPVDGAGYAALFAAASAPTLGQTLGGVAYSLIKTRRRTLPSVMPSLDGSVDYQGLHYPAADVQIIGGVVSLPSRFAGAIDV